MPPAWLAELHKQWLAARGSRIGPRKKAFTRDWENLLDDAGLTLAEDRAVAAREAERYETEGKLELRRHRYRKYIIEKVAVPVASEVWLAEMFSSLRGDALLAASRAIVQHWCDTGHPLIPDSWRDLCHAVDAAFSEPRVIRPFYWRAPEEVEGTFALLHAVTSREWPRGTLVRDASKQLGLPTSKELELRRRILESALSLLFHKRTPLEALGLICSMSKAQFHGPLTLHFGEGDQHTTHSLQGDTTLALKDLLRASHATTTATRLLTIENAKDTFQQAIARNQSGRTLIIATSFPTEATLRLLALLPAELPHFHFGDTDPSGYAILRALRERSLREVQRFHMSWCDEPHSPLLSDHDKRTLQSLLKSDLLADCHDDMERMNAAGRKGRFEQEASQTAALDAWEF